ncbi:Thiol:disulfide interchange protein DsbA [Salmonella enterica subsp. enterica serovar Napoli]|nr:Thiol:disulfide interchange protein DsbA [Salmonella enterica subsp. enterica serovar Napoli]
MKKIWLALAGMVLAFSASAAQISDGKQYITLDKPVAGEPSAGVFLLLLPTLLSV